MSKRDDISQREVQKILESINAVIARDGAMKVTAVLGEMFHATVEQLEKCIETEDIDELRDAAAQVLLSHHLMQHVAAHLVTETAEAMTRDAAPGVQ